MHLLLTGATGLVGSAVLNHILTHAATSQITTLTILSRNPTIPLLTTRTPPPNLTINIIPHQDFLTYPPRLLSTLSTTTAIIWTLGISQTQTPSPSTYHTITHDYPLAAALAFGSNPSKPPNQPLTFVYVSGEGATLTPGRFTPLYARVKGQTEQALLELNASAACPDLRVYSARPGGVDPAADPAVMEATVEKRAGGPWRRLEPVLMPLLRVLVPAMVSPTAELGKALTRLAVGDGERMAEGPGVSGEGRTVGNVALMRMAGL